MLAAIGICGFGVCPPTEYAALFFDFLFGGDAASTGGSTVSGGNASGTGSSTVSGGAA